MATDTKMSWNLFLDGGWWALFIFVFKFLCYLFLVVKSINFYVQNIKGLFSD